MRDRIFDRLDRISCLNIDMDVAFHDELHQMGIHRFRFVGRESRQLLSQPKPGQRNAVKHDLVAVSSQGSPLSNP